MPRAEERAREIIADFAAWLTQHNGPTEPLKLLHAEITRALDEAVLEERRRIVAWLNDRRIVLAIDHDLEDIVGAIAFFIERGDHLEQDKAK